MRNTKKKMQWNECNGMNIPNDVCLMKREASQNNVIVINKKNQPVVIDINFARR